MLGLGRDLWISAMCRFLVVTGMGHLLWEIFQMPLYTLWTEGTFREIAFAVAHCTGGDILIALASLTGALILAGDADWPAHRFCEVAALTLLLGIAYTVYSEWLNVSVRRSWAYAPSMPTLPPLGTGLAPVLQWIVIPSVALHAARGAAKRGWAPSKPDRG